jgi:hypothetical protein
MYDIMGRELNNTDKKIGFSEVPVYRENSLNRTKSPIGYKIILLFEVDNMRKVEKMLHSILDSRRVYGEWFKDDEDTLTGEFNNFMIAYGATNVKVEEDTLTGEFNNFMIAYGATNVKVEELKPDVNNEPDNRLKDLATSFGQDVALIRTYKGVDYEVTLRKDGMLSFMGELFDTPNKLFNNGVVKYARGVKCNSGTNNLSQLKIKSTGERLKD